jgi:hypothetical protein
LGRDESQHSTDDDSLYDVIAVDYTPQIRETYHTFIVAQKNSIPDFFTRQMLYNRPFILFLNKSNIYNTVI